MNILFLVTDNLVILLFGADWPSKILTSRPPPPHQLVLLVCVPSYTCTHSSTTFGPPLWRGAGTFLGHTATGLRLFYFSAAGGARPAFPPVSQQFLYWLPLPGVALIWWCPRATLPPATPSTRSLRQRPCITQSVCRHRPPRVRTAFGADIWRARLRGRTGRS